MLRILVRERLGSLTAPIVSLSRWP